MLDGITKRLSKLITPRGSGVGGDDVTPVEPTTAATVCGLQLSSCIFNSSNPFATSVSDLKMLEASKAGAVTTRTACPGFEHDDNTMKWATPDDANTINCLGYSPNSFEYYCTSLKSTLAVSGKPGWLSISGYAKEIAEMIVKAGELAKDLPGGLSVEINLSCPNIAGKPPISYDFEGMKEYLGIVFASPPPSNVVVGVKTVPYFYEQQFDGAAEVFNEMSTKGLSFVTCINTVGNGLIIDVETESPLLAPGSYGGLGGPAVHAIALGNVRKLRQKLNASISIIGCGGVDSGEAAFKHLLCGASAVMVASALLHEGTAVFERVENELLAIMKEKGYTTIADFQGKLKDDPKYAAPGCARGRTDTGKKSTRAYVAPEHIKAANAKASSEYAAFAEVPIVDFAPFYTGDATSRAELGAKLLAAFKDIGFVTIINHNLGADLNKKTFEASQKFFTGLSKEQKDKYAWESPESNRGYLAMGQERLDGGLPDLKETFEIGNEAETTFKTPWPNAELPEFRSTMLEYFNAADAVHLDVLRCLAIAMGLGEEFFTPLCNGNHQNLRLLHYPETQRSKISRGGQKRGGVHSDYGSITLLTQWADQGGLEAQRKDGQWVFVPPVEGGIVVNVADCMMRWSNDVLRSTPHCVLTDPRHKDKDVIPARFSIAFFCNPNKETVVECLPGCATEETPPKYKPINAYDYITMRLAGTIDN